MEKLRKSYFGPYPTLPQLKDMEAMCRHRERVAHVLPGFHVSANTREALALIRAQERQNAAILRGRISFEEARH